MLTVLDPNQPDQPFPNPESALIDPDGLLAIDGCLSPKRLINAYQHGIFPWFSSGEPILWWSPNPRLVLYPDELLISRSLSKTLRRNIFSITFDQAFPEVIAACSETREAQEGTWITNEMILAYIDLHQQGIAHSMEAWLNGALVGGLYGLAIGQVFFGESMFHRKTDASKVAFVNLVRNLRYWDYKLIDCQVRTGHLVSLGATDIPREQFLSYLDLLCKKSPSENAWLKTSNDESN